MTMLDGLSTNGELYSVLTALIWAVAVIMFARLGRDTPPVVLNLFKGCVALVLLPPTLLVLGTPFFPAHLGWQDWAQLIASGVIGISIADSLFFASLNRLGAGRSAIVDCLYAPLVVLCGWLFLSEPVGWKLLVAVALMVSAIFIGTWDPRADPSHLDPARTRAGVGLGALAMLLMAIGIALAKPVLDRSDLLWATLVRVAGATVFLGVQALAWPRWRAATIRTFTPGRHWPLLVGAGFVGTYLAMITWLAGMKHTTISISSVLNQTSTLFVPLLAAVFLRERLTARKLVAVCMGFSGAVILNVDLPAAWAGLARAWAWLPG
jgi:drug/metabolite transporter (DMT)-like permease